MVQLRQCYILSHACLLRLEFALSLLTPSFAAVNLLSMAQTAAKNNLWWPFTQHATVLQDNVTVIDSRNGESFAVYKTGNDQGSGAKLQMQYDACASWWTQVQLVHLQYDACLQVMHMPCSL